MESTKNLQDTWFCSNLNATFFPGRNLLEKGFSPRIFGQAELWDF